METFGTIIIKKGINHLVQMKYASVYNCSFHNIWFTSRFTFEVNQHVNRTYAVLSIIKE